MIAKSKNKKSKPKTPTPPVVFRDLFEALAYIRRIYTEHESPTTRCLGFTFMCHTGKSTLRLNWGQTRLKRFKEDTVFIPLHAEGKTSVTDAI